MNYNGVDVECGYGWKGLYEPLIDLCNLKGIKVNQVKEKFGMLRFYVDKPDLDQIIDAAESYSKAVCEACGELGGNFIDGAFVSKVTRGPSKMSTWIMSLCAPCREARDAKRTVEVEEFNQKHMRTHESSRT